MIVDDASIVDFKACQFESWMDRDSKSATFWILPACNFTGNLELTPGGAWTYKAGSTRNTDVGLQGKTIFKSLDTNGWGLGLAAGALWRANDNSNHRAYELYARLPVSFSFNEDRILVHGNIGWNFNGADRENHLLWGVAGEAESHCSYLPKSSAESVVIPFSTSGSGIGLCLNGYTLTPPTVTASELPPLVISFP